MKFKQNQINSKETNKKRQTSPRKPKRNAKTWKEK